MHPIEPSERPSGLQKDRAAPQRTVAAWFTLLTCLSAGTTSQAMQPKLTPSELVHLRNLCSDAAEQAFQTHWGHPPSGITLLGFTNHYDVKADRCYLMVTYREGKSTWFDVSDTQTGKTQAHIKIGSPDSAAPAKPHGVASARNATHTAP